MVDGDGLYAAAVQIIEESQPLLRCNLHLPHFQSEIPDIPHIVLGKGMVGENPRRGNAVLLIHVEVIGYPDNDGIHLFFRPHQVKDPVCGFAVCLFTACHEQLAKFFHIFLLT